MEAAEAHGENEKTEYREDWSGRHSYWNQPCSVIWSELDSAPNLVLLISRHAKESKVSQCSFKLPLPSDCHEIDCIYIKRLKVHLHSAGMSMTRITFQLHFYNITNNYCSNAQFCTEQWDKGLRHSRKAHHVQAGYCKSSHFIRNMENYFSIKLL